MQQVESANVNFEMIIVSYNYDRNFRIIRQVRGFPYVEGQTCGIIE